MSDGLQEIFQSTKTSKELEKMSNKEITLLLMKYIWVDYGIFSPQSDLIDEAIRRLKDGTNAAQGRQSANTADAKDRADD